MIKKILFITSKNRQYECALQGISSIRNSLEVDLTVKFMRRDAVFDEQWRKALVNSDCVCITHAGTGVDTPFLEDAEKWLRQYHPMYIMVLDTEGQKKENPKKGIGQQEEDEILLYLAHFSQENYGGLVSYLLSLTGSMCEVVRPKLIPWYGIVGINGEVYESYGAYRQSYPEKSKNCIGILFYREEWIEGTLEYQRALIECIQQKGWDAVLFFSFYGRNEKTGQTSLKESMDALFGPNQCPLSAIINTCKFSSIGLKGVLPEELIAYDIPWFTGTVSYGSEVSWQERSEGLPAQEITMSLAMPEMDGCIHGGLVATKEQGEEGFHNYHPIRERVEAVVERVYHWVRLRNIPNKDKRVAIIFHNYPPTNATIGSAAGLDTRESGRQILQAMYEAGYTIDYVPATGQDIIERVVAHATNDKEWQSEDKLELAEGKLTPSNYSIFYTACPPKVQQQMEMQWGKAPGNVYVHQGDMIVPGFSNGNIWIMLQPPRGFSENPSALYHDPLCPPTHQYEGVYHWLRYVWKADAVIHVGTHGSLEWLPGKGTALSDGCYPEMAIDYLPNIYPYWTTIVGEGLQAKRRSAACLIGHLSPPMTRAGLYSEYAELERMIDEYEDYYRHGDMFACDQVYCLLKKKAYKCHLLDKGGEIHEKEKTIQVLHEKLTDLKFMQIRCGLHVLGQVPNGKKKVAYLIELLRTSNPGAPSLVQCLQSIDSNEDCWQAAEEMIEAVLDERRGQEAWQMTPRMKYFWQRTQEKDRKALYRIVRSIRECYVPALAQTGNEIAHIIHALDGGYIPVGPGGAIFGGRADVLPTGRNFFGVDERALPTKTAYTIGMKLADELIMSFIKKEGKYPEEVGIVLWADNTARNYGQCVAQFLYLLGVRPVWQDGGGRVIGLEVIPLEELKRPRIDVTGRISGLMRDMMPTTIQWLDKAVLLVADREESWDENYIRKHIQADMNWLIEQGEAKEDARIKSSWRIFGDPPGAYGAGVNQVIDNKNWETLDDLARVYTTWSSYSYSTQKSLSQDKRLFERRMATIDVTVKNEDNREVSLLSTDDFSSYHGGMIAAVKHYSGKVPMSFVGDTSNIDQPVVRQLKDEIERTFRGEAVNPKFIKGMMEHGYKGAADMAGYVAHTFAWDATAGIVDDWIYEEYATSYVLDHSVREWMQEVNPWAVQRMVNTLLEAIKRGLWQATEEMENQLASIFLSVDGDLEERSES